MYLSELIVCEYAEKPSDSDRVWQAEEGGKEIDVEKNAQTTQETTCCVTAYCSR